MADEKSIYAYLESRRDFARVDADVDRLMGRVREAGEALEHKRAKFAFAGTLPPVPVDSSAGSPQSGDSWLTAQQIHELLVRWHGARKAVKLAWHKVPGDLRDGLVAPRPGAD